MNDSIEKITLLDSTTDGSHQWWEMSDDVSCQLEFKTLQDGLSQSVQMVQANVGRTRLSLVLSRAGNIRSLAFDGVEVGWKSPVQGPVHPQFVPLYRPDGLGWLEGFDEVLARCGFGNVGGPEFNERHQLVQPLHGALSSRPCRSAVAYVDRERRQVVLETEVDECVFHFQRIGLKSRITLSMDEPTIHVADTIANLGGREAEVMLLHHWNFGPPVIDKDSEIYVTFREMAPRNSHAASQLGQWDSMPEGRGGSEETVYFFEAAPDELGMGTALACDPQRQRGVQVAWHAAGMPCFTLWKNPVAREDGYAIGLEPGTCYPNGRTHESQEGRTVKLSPGQTHAVEVRLTGWMNQPERLGILIDQIQNRTAGAVRHSQPQSKFGPV